MKDVIGTIVSFTNLAIVQKSRTGKTRHGRVLAKGEFHAGNSPVFWYKIYKRAISLSVRHGGKMFTDFYQGDTVETAMEIAEKEYGSPIRWHKPSGGKYEYNAVSEIEYRSSFKERKCH